MNILMTGSAGFLGRHLVADLRARGHFVIGIDLVAEAPGAASYFAQHDLRTPLRTPLPAFEVCIHLASAVGGFLHNAETAGLDKNELALIAQVKTICARSGCEKILYASSTNVFEIDPIYYHGPLTVFNQRTPYAIAKAQTERFIVENFSQFAIFRPTNLFGEDQQRLGERIGQSHVIPDLLHKIAAGPIVEVLGDGRQVRNFLHVSDAVRFIGALLTATPARSWFNIRSNIYLSIASLARELLAISGQTREIIFRPEFLRYEPRAIPRFDLTAPMSLGWQPRVNRLADGLTPTVRPLHVTYACADLAP